MNEPIHIISLGAGVQSSTKALMASMGLITPMPRCGIFADTQREPESVYRWLSWLCGGEVKHRPDGRPYVEPGIYQSGVLKFPIHIVTAGDIAEDALRVRVRKDGKGSWVPSGVPHYSINIDGTNGHGPRQCTQAFKIIPIEKEQRKIVGKPAMLEWRRKHRDALRLISQHAKAMVLWKRLKKQGVIKLPPLPPQPHAAWDECQNDALVVTWIGISTDEIYREKPSRVPWARNRFPHLERGTNRDGCMEWMEANGFPEPPKSACEFCPYHDDDEWIRLRDKEPESFARAVAFDYAYRAAKVQTVAKKGFETFLHPSRVPLDKAVFVKSHGKQMTMFNNECEGMCGV